MDTIQKNGPSDRAIAQAFREAKQQFGGRGRWQSNSEWIDWRASEIDAKQPPAGARDAVTDEMVERAFEAYQSTWDAHEKRTDDKPLPIRKLVRAALEAALTGKAAGGVSTKEMHDRIEAHFARMDAAATGMGDVVTDALMWLRSALDCNGLNWDRDQWGAADASLKAALAAQPAPVLHSDDAAVDAFANAMKEKLATARAKGRGGWDDTSDPELHQHLSNLLREHVEKGDPRDVANFCMFLHQRGESILPTHAIDEAQPAPVVGGVKAVVPDGYELVWKPTLADMRERIAVESMAVHGDSVWYWQGDGYDFPESMTCPVIMSASALRALLAARPGGEDE